MESIEFLLNRQHIELYKLLKATALTSSGGEAKHLIDQGTVFVNGEPETRKRKKLVVGDEVVLFETRIIVIGNIETRRS